MTTFKNEDGLGRWVECLLRERGLPSTHGKSLVWLCVSIPWSKGVETGRQIPEAHPASLAESVSSRFSKRFCTKKQGGEKSPLLSCLASTCTGDGSRTCVHMHAKT